MLPLSYLQPKKIIQTSGKAIAAIHSIGTKLTIMTARLFLFRKIQAIIEQAITVIGYIPIPVTRIIPGTLIPWSKLIKDIPHMKNHGAKQST